MPTFSQILSEARAGHLTQAEMTQWIQVYGPGPNQVSQVLALAKHSEPHINLGWLVQNGQILYLPKVLGPNAPGSPVEAPIAGSPSSGSDTNDWQHLMLRIAEFGLGAGLILIGVSAIVKNTSAGRAATGTAKTALKVAAK